MFCRSCGNELPDGVKFCPACGAEVKPAQEAPKPAPVQPVYEAPKSSESAEKWNVLAIVSFSVAVLGVLTSVAGGVVLHIVTLVLSIIALTQFKKNPKLKGKGFAIAGVVISAASVGFTLFVTILSVILSMFGIVANGLFGLIGTIFTGIFGIAIRELINQFFNEAFSGMTLLPTMLF